MAALAHQLPSLLIGTASALGIHAFAPTWSNERASMLGYEAVARLHATNRPSIQAQYDDGEFSSFPLVAVQTLRVRFRDVGQLPPMNLEDEVGEFIED
jgi:hypothetical protein